MSAEQDHPHIRKRIPSRGGNQFYKARPLSDEAAARLVVTFCGAPATIYDLGWKDRNYKWTRANACAACVAAVAVAEKELVR